MAREELEGASPARMRELLRAELERSAKELTLPRAGREEPVTIAVSPGVTVVTPVRDAFDERLLPVLRAALAEVGEGQLLAGDYEGFVALRIAADVELAVLAIDEAIAGIDRLRASALVLPGLEATGLRPVREVVRDDTLLPHDDPEPARRVARRMLMTLRGKGKWGGYHSEVTNLARGFKDEWELAEQVGEALVKAELLLEKPSVGQRHVSLNPRRKGDIDRLIDSGEVPGGLTLPFK